LVIVFCLAGISIATNSKSGSRHDRRGAAHQSQTIEGLHKRPEEAITGNTSDSSVESLLTTLNKILQSIYSFNSGRKEIQPTN
jgi:hypothetical protein